MEEKNTLSLAEFEQIKSRWEKLNIEYDAQIQRFLNSPQTVSFNPEERERNTTMQAELAELEATIQKVEAGTVSLSAS